MPASIEIQENWLSRESHGLRDFNCHNKVWLSTTLTKNGKFCRLSFMSWNCDGSWTLIRYLSSWKVEWIQQQVVKKRTKRDYDLSRAQSTYFNDPKWPSMWYMVSSPMKSSYSHVVQFSGVWTKAIGPGKHRSGDLEPVPSSRLTVWETAHCHTF